MFLNREDNIKMSLSNIVYAKDIDIILSKGLITHLVLQRVVILAARVDNKPLVWIHYERWSLWLLAQIRRNYTRKIESKQQAHTDN